MVQGPCRAGSGLFGRVTIEEIAETAATSVPRCRRFFDHAFQARLEGNGRSAAAPYCPTCQSRARAAWVAPRTAEWLTCEYWHVVFTIPDTLAAVNLQNKTVVYGALFRATAETLRTIAADPRHLGAEIGFFAVLHTWGPTLVHHPHLHGVVPEDRGAWTRSLAPVRQTEWVVYAKRPFAGAQQVLDDVGRYPHRVALSNDRRRDIEHDPVRVTDKDYRVDPTPPPKTLTLAATECIRRFLLHVRPSGLHRIRDYGFLGARHRAERLTRCRPLLGPTPSVPTPIETMPIAPSDDRAHTEPRPAVHARRCPACGRGHVIVIERLRPRRVGSTIRDTS